jgi:hypothetical protein
MESEMMYEIENFHNSKVHSKYPVIFMLCHIFSALKKVVHQAPTQERTGNFSCFSL